MGFSMYAVAGMGVRLGVGQPPVGLLARQVAEAGADHLDDLLMVEVAGGGDDDGVRAVAPRHVVAQALRLEGGDGFRGADDGLAQDVAGPQRLREQVMDQIIRLVVAPLDLFQDDVEFAPHLLRVEGGVQEHIAQHIHGQWDVFREDTGVIAGVFFGREGVDVAADGVDLVGDLLGVPGRRPLEQHMFDDVGDAPDGVVLVPRPDPHPDAKRHRLHIGDVLSDDTDAVGQHFALDHNFRKTSSFDYVSIPEMIPYPPILREADFGGGGHTAPGMSRICLNALTDSRNSSACSCVVKAVQGTKNVPRFRWK